MTQTLLQQVAADTLQRFKNSQRELADCLEKVLNQHVRTFPQALQLLSEIEAFRISPPGQFESQPDPDWVSHMRENLFFHTLLAYLRENPDTDTTDVRRAR